MSSTMSRERHTTESAKARAGQLLTAHGWERDRRRQWLEEHAQLGPKELLKAAEEALGKDHTVWRELGRGKRI